MAVERQSSTLPPAQPSYILRGHSSQIHSVRFARQNSRLLTGDAQGWVVHWKLETKRALAVWKAHDGAILGAEEWGREKIITHGRDNNLRIWQLRPADEVALSTVLPAEDAALQRPKPWLLHTLPVNTLNFAAFSLCYEHMSGSADKPASDSAKESGQSSDPILIATPSTDDKKINVYQFPEEKLKYVVPKVSRTDTGMVMAVRLVHHPASRSILVLAGYEAGVTSVHHLPSGASSNVRSAQVVYLSQPHTQPILSLDVSPDGKTFFTSSADAIIAAHHIPDLPSPKHHSSNLATTEQRVDSAIDTIPNTPISAAAEPSALSPTTSSDPPPSAIHDFPSTTTPPPSSPHTNLPLSFTKRTVPSTIPTSAGLSSLLSTAPPQPNINPQPSRPPAVTLQPPYKVANTKHAGQQSLRVRSDGRILVTGGWDSRIRIYSAKTLKEVAVLKWHKEGVYAVDFAQVLNTEDLVKGEDGEVKDDAVVKRETGLGKLRRQREAAMQTRHWVAAGAKDGKVSLWEVF